MFENISENFGIGGKAVIIAKIIFAVFLIILAIVIFKKISTWIQNQRKNQLLNNSVVSSGGVSIDLGSKAAKIYDSFYNYYGGLSEDEQTAMDTLKSVPKQYVPQLSNIYFSLYAKNLREDFVKYLSTSEFNSVSYQFN